MLNPFLIPVAYADVNTLVQKVNKVILNPLIVLMFAVALMYFLYGVFEFISNTEDIEKRATGKVHMFWGVVGMFIMMAVFTIMSIITNTLGADDYIQDNGQGGNVILDQK